MLADLDGRGNGTERARERISELRNVCEIWKGTGEERGRGRWVDGLEDMVDGEARKREEGRKKNGVSGSGQGARRETSAVRSGDVTSGGGGPGFLRRLREEIYME